MAKYVKIGRLSAAKGLFDFINQSVLPELKITQSAFWSGFENLVYDLSPKNVLLLQKRAELQAKINAWHLSQKGASFNKADYKKFLSEIGYIVSEGSDFSIETENVDTEISVMAGSQLVVPISNPRYALNAANARWGSLYDALYGTDAIEPLSAITNEPGFNLKRGEKVVSWVRAFLDEVSPLISGSHSDVTGYFVSDKQLNILLNGNSKSKLKEPTQLSGYTGNPEQPSSIILTIMVCTLK